MTELFIHCIFVCFCIGFGPAQLKNIQFLANADNMHASAYILSVLIDT